MTHLEDGTVRAIIWYARGGHNMFALRVYISAMAIILVASLGSVAYVAYCLRASGGF